MQPAVALVCALCLSAIGPSYQFRLPWTKSRQGSFEDFERETGLSQLGDPVSANREIVYVGAPDRTEGAKFAAYQEAAGNPLDTKDEVEEPMLKKTNFVYGPDHEDNIRPAEPPLEQPADGEYPVPPDDADISDMSRRASIPEWWLTNPDRRSYIHEARSEESEDDLQP
ncbi:uncharacterized protein LOC124711674 [Schistocerca piceifrons]|uniref:uncharacterized protein LOC124711674 n=1 Tax=Schistocerca piceifrons TaxID=274613 RepID=UPI001F5E4ACC|nr:uncharacterized protein LOC124711674 [Schistocerca piceifrons]XP_047097825.1 uncharacterized protein LOC124711674 [Schistocerca piceifrons]